MKDMWKNKRGWKESPTNQTPSPLLRTYLAAGTSSECPGRPIRNLRKARFARNMGNLRKSKPSQRFTAFNIKILNNENHLLGFDKIRRLASSGYLSGSPSRGNACGRKRMKKMGFKTCPISLDSSSNEEGTGKDGFDFRRKRSIFCAKTVQGQWKRRAHNCGAILNLGWPRF